MRRVFNKTTHNPPGFSFNFNPSEFTYRNEGRHRYIKDLKLVIIRFFRGLGSSYFSSVRSHSTNVGFKNRHPRIKVQQVMDIDQRHLELAGSGDEEQLSCNYVCKRALVIIWYFSFCSWRITLEFFLWRWSVDSIFKLHRYAKMSVSKRLTKPLSDADLIQVYCCSV